MVGNLSERTTAMATEGELQGTIELNVQEGIDRDSLIRLIDLVIDEHGCQVCGLVGLDLELRTRGVLGERFADTPGLMSARLRPPR
jgi:hypothetical protein